MTRALPVAALAGVFLAGCLDYDGARQAFCAQTPTPEGCSDGGGGVGGGGVGGGGVGGGGVGGGGVGGGGVGGGGVGGGGVGGGGVGGGGDDAGQDAGLAHLLLAVRDANDGGATGQWRLPDGGACTSCELWLPAGSAVELTAEPGQYSVLSGFDQCTREPGTRRCRIDMTAVGDIDVAAIFDRPNLIFVSSVSTPVPIGSLGFDADAGADGGSDGGSAGAPRDPLAFADAFCNGLALNAGLPGTYVAWLSTSTTPITSRLASSEGWIRTDAKPVFDHLLTTAQLLSPFDTPSLDELGAPVAPGLIPTGTHADTSVGDSCGDWTNPSSLAYLVSGTNARGGIYWTQSGDGPGACATAHRLYCLGVGRKVAVSPVDQTNPQRLAFVTAQQWLPNDGGVASADALCQQEAAAQLGADGGTYLAMLSTSTLAYQLRMANGPPWVRPDGVTVVESPTDFRTTPLFDAPLFNPPTTGSGDLASRHKVWLGLMNDNCNDWTYANPGGNHQLIGYSWAQGDLGAAGPNLVTCANTPVHLVCFEQ